MLLFYLKLVELTEDIAKMSAGNKKLRKERGNLQKALDDLESQLSKVSGIKDEEKPEEDFFGVDTSARPREQLESFRKKLRYLEDELGKEQKKSAKVEKEMDQLNKHLAGLSSSNKRDGNSDPPASGAKAEGSSEIADLEARILELRRKQASDLMSLVLRIFIAYRIFL